VPLSVTVCGDPLALSVTETVALKLATEAGVKVTAMLHDAPAATEPPHVSLSSKSDGFVPAIAILLMVSTASPVFLSVMFCAALVVPVAAVKLSEDGVNETAGVGTTEKFAVTLWAAFIVTDVEALSALATLPVQLLNWKPAFAAADSCTTVPEA